MRAGDILVEPVTDATDEHVSAIERLLPQLSSSASAPDRAALAAILADKDTHLFSARLDELDNDVAHGPLVGYAVLVVFSTLSGRRGLLEDVVVDEAAGGRGIGQLLVEKVLSTARAERCRTVDLTSRPSRETANRLYARCGFEQRATNVWRYELSGP